MVNISIIHYLFFAVTDMTKSPPQNTFWLTLTEGGPSQQHNNIT